MTVSAFGVDHADAIAKRDFSAGQRKKLTAKGDAIDGKLPVKDARDLANAERLAGKVKGVPPKRVHAYLDREKRKFGVSKDNTSTQYASPERLATGALFPVAHGAIAGRKGKKLKAVGHEAAGTALGSVVPGPGSAIGAGAGTAMAHRKGLYKPDHGTQRTGPIFGKSAFFDEPVGKAYTSGQITLHHEQAQMHARKKVSARRQGQAGIAAGTLGIAVAGNQHLIGNEVERQARKVRPGATGAVDAARAGVTARRIAAHGGVAAALGGAGVAGVGLGRAAHHAAAQNRETRAAQKARRERTASMSKAFDPEKQRHRRADLQAGAAAGGAVVAASGARRSAQTARTARSDAGTLRLKAMGAHAKVQGNLNSMASTTPKTSQNVSHVAHLHREALGQEKMAGQAAKVARVAGRKSKAGAAASAGLGVAAYAIHRRDQGPGRSYGYR